MCASPASRESIEMQIPPATSLHYNSRDDIVIKSHHIGSIQKPKEFPKWISQDILGSI